MRNEILFNIFKFRFPKNITEKQFIDFLLLKKDNKYIEELKIYELSIDKFKVLKIYFKKFLSYYNKKKNLKLSDISLGNIILASSYLYKNKKFNASLVDIENFLDLKHRVLNVTNGQNLFLAAILDNGDLIHSEGDLVEKKHKNKILDLYLFRKKEFNFKKLLRNKNIQEKRKILKKFIICFNTFTG